MSDNSDDYGELDAEELIDIAAYAEQGEESRSHQDQGASDGRRASLIGDADADEDILRRANGARSKRGQITDHSVSPVDDIDSDAADSVGSGSVFAASNAADAERSLTSRGKRRRIQVMNDDASPPAKRQKSKYRIHIPKQREVPKDLYFTQPPPPSSSPYRIRGPIWQKIKKEPRAGTASCASIHQQAETENVSAPSSEEDAFDRSHHLPRSSVIAEGMIEGSPMQIMRQDEHAYIPSQVTSQSQRPSQAATRPPASTQTNLRQTTLFGTRSTQTTESSSLVGNQHSRPTPRKDENPTHHKLDGEALKTWVYPTNLGAIRDYQYNIVQRGLYHNLLVALPTGLGKTFIAATVMLNYYRWTVDSQIIFAAPTKPLVAQQVEACFKIAGIPRSATSMLTGETASRLRSDEYVTKRVFFMTPQTLMNDLGNGNCDPKRIVLLVIDEAHRATGSYAYVEIVKLLRRFNKSFRVLALTATPGASVEAVQAVVDGLDISRVEIRTENSLDIRQYVHTRRIDTQVFDYSEEIEMLLGLWQRTLQPLLTKLNGINAYWAKDPITLTPFGLMKARQAWSGSDAGRKAHMGVKAMVNAIFTILSSRAHATELLKYHGIGPFYHNLVTFRDGDQSGEKGSKYRREILDNEHFRKLMSRVQGWVNQPEFVGHPKLEYLRGVVLNHFLDVDDRSEESTSAEHPGRTRIMVFVHYRDSAEEVARVLERHGPIIRPHVFVGQADSKRSEGMDQKTQFDIIEKFKKGVYNTLVATSIGEEGLDIGEVDLIVCYDSSASPIRMLQRMGRTGRKRAGNIVVLLMRGKEENSFTQAKDNYEKMQQMIASGSRFTFHEERSSRIVPKEVQPTVEKRYIEIPPENTQPGLPEPKKCRKPLKKKEPKKFHMPDGVRTGFVKASRLKGKEVGLHLEVDDDDDDLVTPKDMVFRECTPELAVVPPLAEVVLAPAEERELATRYLDVGGDVPQTVDIPRLDAFPSLQRTLRPTKHVGHGRATRGVVDMLNRMHQVGETPATRPTRRASAFDDFSTTPEKRLNRFTSVTGAGVSHSGSISPDDKPPRSPSGGTMPRTGVDADDRELNDFIVDGSPDASDSQGRLSSVRSSPPPLQAPIEKPFYVPIAESQGRGTQSEEDFPEISNLMGAGNRAQGHQSLTQPSRQRRRERRIILESEDE